MSAERVRIQLQGAVQGLGFRPFVWRLAKELRLAGWVRNDPQGLVLEVEGSAPALSDFRRRLVKEAPPHAVIEAIRSHPLPTVREIGFHIATTADHLGQGFGGTLILPDLAPCRDCLHELSDPSNRRHHYPFINCTQCGPRYSIVERPPWDRQRTTMRRFKMCAACQAEYDDPTDRRFHAEPIACPECGPTLALLNARGETTAPAGEALRLAAEALRSGGILALKGLGGYQLLVSATDDAAVRRLRERKGRESKPFALMMAHPDSVRAVARFSPEEKRLLESPAAPIVLLKAKPGNGIASAVAPDNPYLGVMLPSTPLHHLLLREVGGPLVATSGNRSGEPISVDEDEALTKLDTTADAFLVHDRPIARPVDDSVAWIVAGETQILRRARGYAPLPIHLDRNLPPALGLGSYLKSTVALASGSRVFLSQHLGDLETSMTRARHRQTAVELPMLFGISPQRVCRDLHPGFPSLAIAGAAYEIHVQHHLAHLAACLAENRTVPPALGIVWDGSGYGPDGTIWGGEFLTIGADDRTWHRVAHFRPFPLPGAEAAVREPRRSALGAGYEVFGASLFETAAWPSLDAFTEPERRLLRGSLEKQVNCPRTSSAGRLFDAAASLLGLRQKSGFEGDAAMALEFAALGRSTPGFACPVSEGSPMILDWEPLLSALIRDRERGASPNLLAAKFHHALIEAAVEVARRVNLHTVALSGGCFQNRLLAEGLVGRLRAEGFVPLWHRQVPPNDGGIALGQVAITSWDTHVFPQVKPEQTLNHVPRHSR